MEKMISSAKRSRTVASRTQKAGSRKNHSTQQTNSITKAAHVKQTQPLDKMTESFRKSVNEAIAVSKMRGNPVAKFDLARKAPYMEYADGRREY